MSPKTKAVRQRPLVLDAVLVLAVLALGGWFTFRDGHTVQAVPLVVTAVVAVLFGVGVGMYARSADRRQWLVIVLMALVVVVFVLLVGVHGAFEGVQWAWLFAAFAGLVVGVDLAAVVGRRGQAAGRTGAGRSGSGPRGRRD